MTQVMKPNVIHRGNPGFGISCGTRTTTSMSFFGVFADTHHLNRQILHERPQGFAKAGQPGIRCRNGFGVSGGPGDRKRVRRVAP